MSRLRTLVRLLVVVALLGGWALYLRPTSLGGPAVYLVIRGDSMSPTFESGDLVVLQASDRFAVGDVVGYRVPAGELGAGRLVVHRIVGGDPDGGFVVLGDGNPAIDPWQPTARDVVGRAWVAVPGLGRLIAALHQPILLAALAAAIVVAAIVARPMRDKPGASPRGSRPRPSVVPSP